MSSSYCDFYGRNRSGRNDTSPVDIPMPYQVASISSTDSSTGNKTVIRFTRFDGGNTRVAMWKETTVFAGTSNDILSYTHEFAIDLWVNRETEDVVWVPINECWDYKEKHPGV